MSMSTYKQVTARNIEKDFFKTKEGKLMVYQKSEKKEYSCHRHYSKKVG